MNPKLQNLIQCQRNWDSNQTIADDDLALILEYAQEPPQQQGNKYFNILVLHNSAAKQRLYRILTPNDVPVENRNLQPQVLANTTLVWTLPQHQQCDDGDFSNGLNEQFHVGFHSGIVAELANNMGYATSFTRCGPYTNEAWISWLKTHNLSVEDHYSFGFALGIGYANTDLQHNIDHVTGHAHEHYTRHTPTVTVIK